MKSNSGTTYRATHRWALLAAALLLLVIVISGCNIGGSKATPLTTAQRNDLGKEMAAIERLTPDQLGSLDSLTPLQIELYEKLSPAQVANLAALKPSDVRLISLGKDTAVIARITPAQLTAIAQLTGKQLSNLNRLKQVQLDFIAKMTKAQYDRIEKLTPRQLTQIDKQPTQKADDQGIDQLNLQGYATFWQGYIKETNATRTEDPTEYASAVALYLQTIQGNSGYTQQARFQYGVLDAHNLLNQPTPYKIAKTQLQTLTRDFNTKVWVRVPGVAAEGGPATVGARAAADGKPVLYQETTSTAATAQLDTIYRTGGGRDAAYYSIVHRYVSWFKQLSPVYGAALSLIFLALIIKLVTTPMTTASFRGMRDMQRVQPLIKELQEKYKDDKAKLAEAQMKLMKEHKVSPLGGCLPMLIQLPIFWVVYRAVQVYAAGFADAHFLWINNLARPDWPLLILYALSMIVTQKLTTTPAADPQQQAMQKQMTYFMPIFLLFILQTLASAFVLYWFFLNVFSALHQYYLMKKFAREDAARGIVTATPSPAPKKKKGNK